QWGRCVGEECGSGGAQSRTVWCVHAEGWTTHHSNCRHTDKPESQRPCFKVCEWHQDLFEWEVSEWGACVLAIPPTSEGQQRATECVTAQHGLQRRRARCVRAANGTSVTERICEFFSLRPALEQACLIPCPLDCVVSVFSPWSACSRTCGAGRQHRTRHVLAAPMYGGADCPGLTQTQSCRQLPPCPSGEGEHGYSLKVAPWSECRRPQHKDLLWLGGRTTLDFGVGDTKRNTVKRHDQSAQHHLQLHLHHSHHPHLPPSKVWEVEIGYRTRQVRCMSSDGKNAILSLCTQDDGPRTFQSCVIPKHCQTSDWSAWSPCSKTCQASDLSPGYRMRTRTITQPAIGGGNKCPAREEKEACNIIGDLLPKCPRYVWRSTDWGECHVAPLLSQQDRRLRNTSGLCGGGIQTRDTYCVQITININTIAQIIINTNTIAQIINTNTIAQIININTIAQIINTIAQIININTIAQIINTIAQIINTNTIAQIINTNTIAQITINTNTIAQITISTNTVTQITINTNTIPQITINTNIIAQITINTNSVAQITMNTNTIAQITINTNTITQITINTETIAQVTININNITQLNTNTIAHITLSPQNSITAWSPTDQYQHGVQQHRDFSMESSRSVSQHGVQQHRDHSMESSSTEITAWSPTDQYHSMESSSTEITAWSPTDQYHSMESSSTEITAWSPAAQRSQLQATAAYQRGIWERNRAMSRPVSAHLCDGVMPLAVRSCSLPCPQPCLLSSWSSWGPCLHDNCMESQERKGLPVMANGGRDPGQGYRQRRRQVLGEGSGNTENCGHLLESVPCEAPTCFLWRVQAEGVCMSRDGTCGHGSRNHTVACVNSRGTANLLPPEQHKFPVSVRPTRFHVGLLMSIGLFMRNVISSVFVGRTDCAAQVGDVGRDVGRDVDGDVEGDVDGDVAGDMGGDMDGDVAGDMGGDMGGDVGGDMCRDADTFFLVFLVMFTSCIQELVKEPWRVLRCAGPGEARDDKCRRTSHDASCSILQSQLYLTLGGEPVVEGFCKDDPPPVQVACEIACPGGCVVSSWSDWSSCSHSCTNKNAEGRQSRMRSVLAWPGEGGKTCPPASALEHWRPCNDHPCVVLYWETSAWGPCVEGSSVAVNRSSHWNETSPCAEGVQTRTVTCVKINTGPVVPKRCPDSARPDSARPCVLACKRDCLVTQFSEWTACPQSCVPANVTMPTQSRYRTVVQRPANGGQECPDTLFEERECEALPVCSIYRWRTHRWHPCTLVPDSVRQGMTGASQSCGRGLETRALSCMDENEEPAAMSECLQWAGRMPTQVRTCWVPCRDDCTFSTWSRFTECTGCGSSSRKRSLTGRSRKREHCHREDQYPLVDTQPCPCVEFLSKPWGSWSPCILPEAPAQGPLLGWRGQKEAPECGGGLRYRAVACLDQRGRLLDPAVCNGTELQVETCHVSCPLDCRLSSWSAWSACSASCGNGLKVRSKWLREKPFNGGRPCPKLDLKNQVYEAVPCLSECWQYEWVSESWSLCAVNSVDKLPACGEGVQTRKIRRCVMHGSGDQGRSVNDSLCDPYDIPAQAQTCILPCPDDCVMSPWSPWSPCPTPCDPNTVRTRTRRMLRPPADGAGCPESNQTEPCVANSNCFTYKYNVSDWSTCMLNEKAVCGEGVRTRLLDCMRSDGRVVATSMCEELGLPQPWKLMDTCQVDCPVSCTLSEWSVWTECSHACGNQGVMLRTRRVLHEAHEEGRPCAFQLSQTKPCPIRPCYSWLLGAWSPCHVEGAECGEGVRERNLSCIVHWGHWPESPGPRPDAPGPPLTVEEERCGERLQRESEQELQQLCFLPCPGDCHLTEWSSWSSCQLTCLEGRSFEAEGHQARSQAVIIQTVENQESCPQQVFETRPCKGGKCHSYEWRTSTWNNNERSVWCQRSDGVNVTGGCFEINRPAGVRHCHPPCTKPFSQCKQSGVCGCERGYTEVMTTHGFLDYCTKTPGGDHRKADVKTSTGRQKPGPSQIQDFFGEWSLQALSPGI
ncbi:hypothetical protein P4O66_015074, partial [Electrophorus voltai]